MTVTLSLNVTIINNCWITLIPLRLLPSAKVQISSSPHINAFYGHKTVCITIDIGATANLIRHAMFVHHHAPDLLTRQTVSPNQPFVVSVFAI